MWTLKIKSRNLISVRRSQLKSETEMVSDEIYFCCMLIKNLGVLCRYAWTQDIWFFIWWLIFILLKMHVSMHEILWLNAYIDEILLRKQRNKIINQMQTIILCCIELIIENQEPNAQICSVFFIYTEIQYFDRIFVRLFFLFEKNTVLW